MHGVHTRGRSFTSLSIRNQIAGTVTAVTADAVEALGLAAGSPVVALVKSTEISLATT
ncbi:TOBE domain-containing protein [Streptomyces virginiae]